VKRGHAAGEPRAEWPPTYEDPFPGHTGIPEIAAGALDAEMLGGAIQHHGSLLIRGVCSRARAGELSAAAERSIDARDRDLAGTPDVQDDDWYRKFTIPHWDTGRERRWVNRNGGMLLIDAPRVYWGVVEALEGAGVLAAIGAHIGEPLAVSTQKSVLRKARKYIPTWHQDGSFMGQAVRTVNVWLNLTDCGPGTQAAGLDVVPTRVREVLPTQTEEGAFSIAIAQHLVDDAAGAARWVSPRFEPGDALLFDELMVHRSGALANPTVDRYAVEMWIFGASTVPEGYAAIRL
jgi:hypothetical protein